jgi:glucan phosphoethanolaminetransferase (alkaline phosphatase superfamily)
MLSWRLRFFVHCCPLIGCFSWLWLVVLCLLGLLTLSKSSNCFTYPLLMVLPSSPLHSSTQLNSSTSAKLFTVCYTLFLLFAVLLLALVMSHRPLRALNTSELNSRSVKRQCVARATISSTAVSISADRSDLTLSVLCSCCRHMQSVGLFLHSVKQLKTCSSCCENVCLLL